MVSSVLVVAAKEIPVAVAIIVAEPQKESSCGEEEKGYINDTPPSDLYSGRSIVGLVVHGVHGSQIILLSDLI